MEQAFLAFCFMAHLFVNLLELELQKGSISITEAS